MFWGYNSCVIGCLPPLIAADAKYILAYSRYLSAPSFHKSTPKADTVNWQLDHAMLNVDFGVGTASPQEQEQSPAYLKKCNYQYNSYGMRYRYQYISPNKIIYSSFNQEENFPRMT